MSLHTAKLKTQEIDQVRRPMFMSRNSFAISKDLKGVPEMLTRTKANGERGIPAGKKTIRSAVPAPVAADRSGRAMYQFEADSEDERLEDQIDAG